MADIELRSSAFSDQSAIPQDYSLDAGNISPPLEWSGVPAEAAELALVCEDPDAPGGTFVHWLLAGITPGTRGLGTGEVLTGTVPGRNDYGMSGYGGPHPPPGKPHHYVFRLYALSQPSGLSQGFTAKDLQRTLKNKVLATGTLTGTYAR